MFKKVISLVIALMIVMGMAAIAVSAAQVEISENAADTPAEVGAEGGAEVGADGGADTGADGGADTAASGQKIYFDASTTGWNNYTIIMVYCYEPESGDIQIDWAAKKKGGMTNEGNDIWSYDFSAKGITLDTSKQYAIIFNADTGSQTCDLLMDATCFGDTAYCNKDVLIENTADSNKKSVEVRWTNNKTLGPMKAITSLGHIVGETVPAYTSPYKMFVKFLASMGKDGLQNALNYSNGKSAQEIIDETASALGLKKGDVKQALAEAAKPADDRTDSHDWSKDWDESKSSLPDGTDESAHTQGDGKKDDSSSGSGDSGSGSGSGDSGSGDSGSGSGDGSGSGSGSGAGASGGASGGSSGGSGGPSGSGSGSATGQDTTVLFIMLGVMVAAAGVIFFVRKKTRT